MKSGGKNIVQAASQRKVPISGEGKVMVLGGRSGENNMTALAILIDGVISGPRYATDCVS